MTFDSHNAAARPPLRREDSTFLGIPVGELGWFSCLLIGVASGFAAFFAATFLGIVSLLVLNSTGRHLDYALSYKRIGLPIGLVVGLGALIYLAVVWTRRKITQR